MPLIHGTSQESLHENIKRLIAEGKKKKEAVAIAYSIQREAKKQGDAGPDEIYRYKNSVTGENYGEPQQFPYL
jgi:hypothetical protein